MDRKFLEQQRQALRCDHHVLSGRRLSHCCHAVHPPGCHTVQTFASDGSALSFFFMHSQLFCLMGDIHEQEVFAYSVD